ncbi:MAG: dihydroorotase, partial [Gemmatimonadetes bacterium]|nr:dihydroorotase [Gemmatimonadota bacterium]
MTTPATLLRGGRLVDPSQQLDEIGDVLISNGVIEACGHVGEVRRDGNALETIDCSGLIISPGFIDVH